jgi:hypothetical protein
MDFRQQQSEEEHQQYLIDRLHKLVILQKIKRGLAGNEEAQYVAKSWGMTTERKQDEQIRQY